MNFKKRTISLALSLSLIMPHMNMIYSYAKEQNDLKQLVNQVKVENAQKEKVSKQLEEKFDLNSVKGDYAATQINKYKLEHNFEYAVKEVLNYYYDEGKESDIEKFERSIDSRAENIITDYKNAAEERDISKGELGYVPGQVLVEFEDKVDDDLKQEVITNLDGKIGTVEDDNLGVIDISNSETVDKALENYENHDLIKSVQPNFIYKPVASYSTAVSTNDTYSSRQYYLDSLGITDAWDYINTLDKKTRVKIAILDTGLDTTHPDLQTNVTLTKDAVSLFTELKKDLWFHGTHVAGIIAATTNNSKGIAGVTNNMADLISINVFTGSGSEVTASTSDIINGYNYAVQNGAKVVNMSLGRLVDENIYSDYDKKQDTLLENAIKNATSKGVVTVCAAGNDNSTMKFYPADFDDCISVINITKDDEKAFDSNYGTKKDISAYGEDIYSSIPYAYANKRYTYERGTSMASPIVAGIVGLMKVKCPDASVDSIKSALYSTAVDIGRVGKDSFTGYGRVDALAAVKQIGSTEAPILTPVSLTIDTIDSSDTKVTGTATKSATIKVYNSSGTLIGSGVASSTTGDYSIAIPKQSGGTTIKIVASKTGYLSTTLTKTVLKRFSVSFTADSIDSNTTKVSGSGSKYATIKAYVDGKQIGSTTVSSDKEYTLTIPKQSAGTVVTIEMSKEGFVNKSLTRTVTDSEVSASVELSVDTIDSSDTKVTGTATKSAAIKVYNSSGTLIGSGVASSTTGDYSIAIPKQSGGKTIKVVASKTGYLSTTLTKTVLKRFSVSFTATTIYSTTTKVNGKGSKSATIKAYVDGKQIGSTTVKSTGSYTLTIPRQSKGKVVTIKMSKTGYVTKSLTRTVK